MSNCCSLHSVKIISYSFTACPGNFEFWQYLPQYHRLSRVRLKSEKLLKSVRIIYFEVWRRNKMRKVRFNRNIQTK